MKNDCVTLTVSVEESYLLESALVNEAALEEDDRAYVKQIDELRKKMIRQQRLKRKIE